MGYAEKIKPVSYLKAHAAEILRDLAEDRQPMIITQNGEAKAVVQDIASYQQAQETLAFLKLIALGNEDIAAGRTRDAREVLEEIRARRLAG